MRFRLTYNGPLKVTKHDGSGVMFTDRRAEHKHAIRREFHKQLKEYWQSSRFLREYEVSPESSQSIMPEMGDMSAWGENRHKRLPLRDMLATLYRKGDYRFVPLVWERTGVVCSLRVLFLRRDWPNSVLTAGDIDNRVKTLIDALKIPDVAVGAPQPDEDPFFVLLDDDRRVTHLEVETDAALLASPSDQADQSFARIVITVDLKPTFISNFAQMYG